MSKTGASRQPLIAKSTVLDQALEATSLLRQSQTLRGYLASWYGVSGSEWKAASSASARHSSDAEAPTPNAKKHWTRQKLFCTSCPTTSCPLPGIPAAFVSEKTSPAPAAVVLHYQARRRQMRPEHRECLVAGTEFCIRVMDTAFELFHSARQGMEHQPVEGSNLTHKAP